MFAGEFFVSPKYLGWQPLGWTVLFLVGGVWLLVAPFDAPAESALVEVSLEGFLPPVQGKHAFTSKGPGMILSYDHDGPHADEILAVLEQPAARATARAQCGPDGEVRDIIVLACNGRRVLSYAESVEFHAKQQHLFRWGGVVDLALGIFLVVAIIRSRRAFGVTGWTVQP